MTNTKANPFEGKNIRGIYDQQLALWWFSAVDICAVLLDTNLRTAQKYWHNMKYNKNKRKFQPLVNYGQLKFPSTDGKYHFTDILTIKDIIYLIQTIPSPKANPCRLWLADMLLENTPIQETFARIGRAYAKDIPPQDQEKIERKDISVQTIYHHQAREGSHPKP